MPASSFTKSEADPAQQVGKSRALTGSTRGLDPTSGRPAQNVTCQLAGWQHKNFGA
jgi:hypothetical protein